MKKRLTVIYHSKTGNTERLINAFVAGAREVSDVELSVLDALKATADDLRQSDLLVLGTPVNFGYMSGALKYFFDQTYYEVERDQLALPYLVVISSDTDATGAISSIETIMKGYGFRSIQTPLVATNPQTDTLLAEYRELGEAIATGLTMGIY